MALGGNVLPWNRASIRYETFEFIWEPQSTIQWRMASGTWFGETSRQSQAEPVKQQHTGISPNHVPEAVPYWLGRIKWIREACCRCIMQELISKFLTTLTTNFCSWHYSSCRQTKYVKYVEFQVTSVTCCKFTLFTLKILFPILHLSIMHLL